MGFKEIGDLTGEAADLVAKVEERQRQRANEWKTNGSLLECVERATGGSRLLLEVLPDDIEQVARLTTDKELEAVDQRLRQCARCEVEGEAACASRYAQEHAAGQRFTWNPELGLRAQACPRYAEYELRERMAAAGCPRPTLDSAIEKIGDVGTREEAEGYVHGFGDALNRGDGILVTGATRVERTRFAVAIVRGLYAGWKVHRCAFVSVRELTVRMRDAMDVPGQPASMRRFLSTAGLLVLDDLEGSFTAWQKDQLGAIIHERWSAARSIVVTTGMVTKGQLDESTFRPIVASVGERNGELLRQMLVTKVDL